jgi:nitrogen-specific signal transduction histidine kinase
MGGRYQRATDLLELKDLLQITTFGLTMDSIADYFEVSRRTAERMIGALRDRFPGVDSETHEGRKYWRLEALVGGGPKGVLAGVVESRQAPDSGGWEAAKSGTGYEESDENLAENPAVGIFVLDADFTVVWISRAMEQFINVDRKEVIGKDLRMLIRLGIGDRLENHVHYVERVFASYNDNTFIEHLRCHVVKAANREERWLDYWSQPINTGPYAGGRIEHYIDVTQRVRAQDAQRRELKAWRGRFQDVDESVKIEGVSTALCYSIVQPLTDIIAIANDPDNHGDESTSADALEEISGLASRIGESLERMLKLTKSQRPVFELVKARPVLAAALDAIEPIAVQSKIEVELSLASNLDNFEFRADVDLLSCGLAELLKNAVEAMPEGGRLWLAASLSDDTGEISFRVSDTGPGIPDHMLERVLLPFFTTRHNANGLGFGIANSVAELHGGSMKLERARSGGASVILRIGVNFG